MTILDIVNFIDKYSNDPTFIINELFIYTDENEIKYFSSNVIKECTKKFQLNFIQMNDTYNKIYCIITHLNNVTTYTIELKKINTEYRWSVYNYIKN